jgi:hypothetical protein
MERSRVALLEQQYLVGSAEAVLAPQYSRPIADREPERLAPAFGQEEPINGD